MLITAIKHPSSLFFFFFFCIISNRTVPPRRSHQSNLSPFIIAPLFLFINRHSRALFSQLLSFHSFTSKSCQIISTQSVTALPKPLLYQFPRPNHFTSYVTLQLTFHPLTHSKSSRPLRRPPRAPSSSTPASSSPPKFYSLLHMSHHECPTLFRPLETTQHLL